MIIGWVECWWIDYIGHENEQEEEQEQEEEFGEDN